MDQETGGMDIVDCDGNPKTDPIVALPGQRLCLLDEDTIAGKGTYERQGYIYASLAGTVHIKKKDKIRYVEIKCGFAPTVVPNTGDIVTARVLQINPRFARCAIHCVGEDLLDRSYRGILRKEDVRAAEKDRVDMYKCYRPNDVILARVLPQTDMSSYQLSTAENELGVVTAVASEAGKHAKAMVPISWTEMQCPETLVKEPRKVAKVLPESALKQGIVMKTSNLECS